MERYQGKLQVPGGIELGEPLADPETTAALLRDHAFDFVLASQHKTPDDGTDYYFYDYTGKDVGAVMDGYFDAVLELVRWGGFHSLAHLTYPFRYIPPARQPAGYGDGRRRLTRSSILSPGRGWRWKSTPPACGSQGCGVTHPDLPLVRRFRELGGERITIGADAHKPSDVGANLADAAALAREAGFRYLTMYFHGQAEMVKIE